MVTPTTRLVLPCATLLALLALPLAAAGPPPDTEVRKAMLAGWQKYDPSIREADLAARAAVPPADPAPAPARIPPTTSPAPPAPPAPATRNGIVVLPKMTVEGRPQPRPRLPRLNVPTPVRDLKGEPLESPAGRRARLVQKHFTRFEQALGRIKIPLISQSLAGRAAQLDAAESAAVQLNEIGDLLEIYALLGLDSPEEQKALRAEFLKAYYNRPR